MHFCRTYFVVLQVSEALYLQPRAGEVVVQVLWRTRTRHLCKYVGEKMVHDLIEIIGEVNLTHTTKRIPHGISKMSI